MLQVPCIVIEPHCLPQPTYPCDPMIERDVIRQAPKVLLHDHLDGGLRPQTVIELAREGGYDGLPTHRSRRAGRGVHRRAPTARASSCTSRASITRSA